MFRSDIPLALVIIYLLADILYYSVIICLTEQIPDAIIT
jgi:hypothetical protein